MSTLESPSGFRRRLLLAAALAISLTATAADEVPAAVMKVSTGSVRVERGNTMLDGKVGLALYPADVVLTGDDGSVGMTFDDNSLLSLGPSSRYAIDHFEFNRATYQGSFQSTLSKGKLAVVSGKIAKHGLDQMQVHTPTSILGVRGTQFVVEVDGETP